MSTHTHQRNLAQIAPSSRRVGGHRIVEAVEWVPGPHPESHRRVSGQSEYAERYLRCRRCGAERLRERDFPAECRGEDR